MSAELVIQNGSKLFYPVVEEGIEWSTERYGSPGKLTFKVILDEALDITEGNQVIFRWNDQDVFSGFIFSKKMDKERIITVTAYDQLRYFKNKESYVYENKTAAEVLRMVCDDFGMPVGTIDPTGYLIPSRIEDGQTLFDIVQNALDQTLTNTKTMYVLFDEFGKISLRGLENMIVPLLIDEETGQNYDYESSIDEATYNQIKLIYDNEETGQRDVYIAQSTDNINAWGVLRHYDTLSNGENGEAKADALLKLYNQKTRRLSVKEAFGDTRVRAGSMVGVVLDLGDVKLQNFMLVESCKHVFRLDEHTMDLNLRGGEFVG